MNKTNNGISAIKVRNAIYDIYLSVGDRDCAKNKTIAFLNNCDVDFQQTSNQLIDISLVKEVACSMLDRDLEDKFLTKL